MSARRLAADAFFVLQLALAAISGGSQVWRLFHSTQGVNVSWLAAWLTYLLINLGLTLKAHAAQPSRVTRQTVATYSAWSLAIAACLGVLLWQGPESWAPLDTLNTSLVAAGLTATWLGARLRGLPLSDPVVRGFFGLCFIGLPQVILAYNIFTVGGAGLAGGMILAGHIGITTRLGQLYFAVREAGWDRHRLGAMVSEMANEVTWILVTLAWLWPG